MGSDLILGLAESYTVAELEDFLKQALADLASGVQVTSINLEGGGGSGTAMKMNPERMVGILRKAIAARQDIDGGGDGSSACHERPMGHAMNFNQRPART